MSNSLWFLSGYVLLLADETTGYPAGGSDRGLRIGVEPHPGGHRSTGLEEASHLPGEGPIPVLERACMLWSGVTLVYRKVILTSLFESPIILKRIIQNAQEKYVFS
jgi:hypothetical protein